MIKYKNIACTLSCNSLVTCVFYMSVYVCVCDAYLSFCVGIDEKKVKEWNWNGEDN